MADARFAEIFLVLVGLNLLLAAAYLVLGLRQRRRMGGAAAGGRIDSVYIPPDRVRAPHRRGIGRRW